MPNETPTPLSPARWLRDPANRNLVPRDVTYLNSVHQGLERYGRLTPNQRDAIVRVMIRRGWRLAPNSMTLYMPPHPEPVAEVAPVEMPVSSPPMSARDETFVPNGTFRVARDGLRDSIRIHTITRSRTANLVDKRVVEYMDYSTYRWVSFAYLTQDHHLRVWRRFQDLEAQTERVRQAIAMAVWMLQVLRECETDLTLGYSNVEYTVDGYLMSVTIDRACTVCDSSVVPTGHVRCHLHNGAGGFTGVAGTTDVPSNAPPPRPRTVIRNPRAPSVRAGVNTGGRTRPLTMSEINPREVQ